VKYFKLPSFCIKGEHEQQYYEHIMKALAFMPNITMDDGADLVAPPQVALGNTMPSIVLYGTGHKLDAKTKNPLSPMLSVPWKKQRQA
jgi:S-adenosylhomocysteine hydrolase